VRVGVLVERVEAHDLDPAVGQQRPRLLELARGHQARIGHEQGAPEAETARQIGQARQAPGAEHDACARLEVEGPHQDDLSSGGARSRVQGAGSPGRSSPDRIRPGGESMRFEVSRSVGRGLLVLFLAAPALATRALATDLNWPQFRGPEGQGGTGETGRALDWTENRNVAWETARAG